MRLKRIPSFPLNVVLFPGEQLPLQIFEPRYRRMVRVCLDEKSSFGMLLALEKGVVRVGCTADILETTKRYDDGRMDILTVGRAPFRLMDLFTQDPLLEGQIDYLEDSDSPFDPSKQKRLIELYETSNTCPCPPLPPDLALSTPNGLSYAIGFLLPTELACKQPIF